MSINFCCFYWLVALHLQCIHIVVGALQVLEVHDDDDDILVPVHFFATRDS